MPPGPTVDCNGVIAPSAKNDDDSLLLSRTMMTLLPPRMVMMPDSTTLCGCFVATVGCVLDIVPGSSSQATVSACSVPPFSTILKGLAWPKALSKAGGERLITAAPPVNSQALNGDCPPPCLSEGGVQKALSIWD